ncbi:MAG: NUDIX domain-containing protein [Chloroflexi bacterium]|nr:NUDIX domain-containing protein [Chloroflexota bacterium]
MKAIKAAGGVVWRRVSDDADEPTIEVAVIHRPRYDDWTIPKGKLAPGESELEGAVREVLEETGHRVHVGRPLGEVRYTKTTAAGDRPKVVRYWAMEADGGSFTATPEVDDLRWLSLAEAGSVLTFERDRELLERFVRGPALSGCVLLVRHASAGERSSWRGDDRDRPLDGTGWEQAQSLVRLLSRYEVGAIVSADFTRCTQTVLPLSDAIGVPVAEEKVFSEQGYPDHEDEALALVRAYGEQGRTVVLCTQGDVIPDLLHRLAREDHVTLPDPIPTKKASVWSLTFDGPRLFGGEYFPPHNLTGDE